MSPLDLAIVVLYLAIVFGIGIYFSRNQKTTEDFFLAGKKVPGWIVIFAIVGTMISSTSFMSIYDYLEKRFNYGARAYGAAAFIISRVVDMSATLYFLAVPVSYLTGFDVWWVILVVGLVTLVMTVAGGIAAVVYADVLQGLLLLAGVLVCLVIALFRPPAGAAEVLRAAWDGGKFGMGNWAFDFHQLSIWWLIIGGAIWAVQRYALDQHIVQKYLVAKTDRQARTSAFVGAVACLPIWLLFFMLGACLWGFFHVTGHNPPPEVARVKDNIVPYFIKTQLPVGMIGLVVAALLAAAMSSLDSDLNSMATVIVEDYYGKLRPLATDSQKLWMGRTTVSILGVCAILFSQLWIGVGTALELGVQLFSIATAGMLGLFALGALTRRANGRGAAVGIIACILFTAWATLTSVRLPALNSVLLDLGPFNYTLHPFLIGILNHLVLLVVGYLASLWFAGRIGTGISPEGSQARRNCPVSR
jgi:SSS family solute:Na+ symporter